ncbi:5288_t:CDS:2, partial [Dentiscutata heterogama]
VYEAVSNSRLSQSSIITPPRQLSPDLELRNESSALRSRFEFQVTALLKQLSLTLESGVAFPRQPSLAQATPLRKASVLESNISNNPISYLNSNNMVIPSPFSEMSIYQISADGSQLMSTTSSALSTAVQNQASQDYLEELKYLFLCVRNP